ncbi:MAG: BrnT family toxin [Gammaproteobacteria bacterium]|nr:BrnT family toxin [Gammaproteobacteria bacterium]
MNNLTFEWDEKKSASNLKKHGIGFDEAQTVFSDELGRLMPDPDHSEGEERFILMGMSIKHRILVICHCEISTDIIRIISARKAEKFERKQYEAYGYA